MRHPKTRLTWPHGWLEATIAITRRLRCGNRMAVYISPDGLLYVRNVGRSMKIPLPDTWLIGIFGRATPTETIEENVVERMREITTRRTA